MNKEPIVLEGEEDINPHQGVSYQLYCLAISHGLSLVAFLTKSDKWGTKEWMHHHPIVPDNGMTRARFPPLYEFIEAELKELDHIV